MKVIWQSAPLDRLPPNCLRGEWGIGSEGPLCGVYQVLDGRVVLVYRAQDEVRPVTEIFPDLEGAKARAHEVMARRPLLTIH